MEAAYLRHSAHERRVAPRLRFLTSPGSLGVPLSAPLCDASGDDMAVLERRRIKGLCARECGERASYIVFLRGEEGCNGRQPGSPL